MICFYLIVIAVTSERYRRVMRCWMLAAVLYTASPTAQKNAYLVARIRGVF